VIARVAKRYKGLPLTEARDHFEAQASRERAGRVLWRACARSRISLYKIANDLRWMGLGPPAPV